MTTSSKSDPGAADALAKTFAFVPRQADLVCSAFSFTFKLIAVVVVALAVGWAWQMWARGVLQPTLQSSGWFAAALAMMLWTQWHILRGRTRLTTTMLEQSWVWRKQVHLAELAHAKLVRVKGFEWLIAPRLYTRTVGNKLTVIYATGPEMLAELQRLEQHLQQARRL
ncbi:MAG: hypothetical protein H7Y28_13900 [Rhodoferax sp.]|nr:hypothetical protein [Rhodoferax sp.]